MKLIVGLGNPGKKYEISRHNVGYIIIDNYVGNAKWSKKDDYEFIKRDDVIYIKPLTYMNLSGHAVSKAVKFYKIDIDDILVIQDDLDLEKGTYKLKKNSSAGGHNGIKNIIECLGTNSFSRLKIGISQSKNIDTIDYVLGNLSKDEIDNLKSNTYKEIIDSFINDGIEKTMNIYNTR